MATFSELQKMNIERQTGESPDDAQEVEIGRIDGGDGDEEAQKPNVAEKLSALFNAAVAANPATYMSDKERVHLGAYETLGRVGNMSDIAMEAGYGNSRLDYKTDLETFLKDPNEARARAQTNAAQIVNGTLKMIPTAVTSGLDVVAGTVAGTLGLAWDTVDGDGGVSFGDSFVNNPVSRALTKANDAFEEILPNYRTNEELTDPWYKHLNANFWGDTFIKNLGFTIGTMGGTALAMKSIGKLSRLSSNIAKGTMAAAAGDAEAATALRTSVGNAEAMYDKFKNAGKMLARQDAVTQVAGSISAAMAESRIEGIHAGTELAEELQEQANAEYIRKLESIDPSLGDEERGALEQQYLDEYQDNLRYIDKQAQKAMALTFGLNMPLLTVSNWAQFGRLFSGSYNTARRALANKVKGGVRMDGERLVGDFRGTGSVAGDYLSAFKPIITEGGEEISQKVISEGAKDIGRINYTEYNDDAYDRDAIHGFWSKIGNIVTSTAPNVFSDADSWQEFAVGALTGALGLPTRGGWQGGIVGEYSQARKDRLAAKEAARLLNERVSSDEFANLWKGYMRDTKYEARKEKALLASDEFTYRTETDKQLVNDILMFANAGRLDELNAIIDHFSDAATAAEIREAYKPANGEVDDFANRSDDEVLAIVRRRAQHVKDTISDYKTSYDAIMARAPLGTSDKKISEMLFTEMQMRSFEKRFRTMFDEVYAAIEPSLRKIAEDDKNGKGAEWLRTFKADLEQALTLGGFSDSSVASLFDLFNEQIVSDIKKYVSDNTIRKKLDDMLKVAKSRNTFYRKLQGLDKMPNAEFEAQAVDEESFRRQDDRDAVDRATASATKPKDVMDFAGSLGSDQRGQQKSEALHEKAASDPNVSAAEEIMNRRKRIEGAADRLVSSITDGNERAHVKSDVARLISNLVHDDAGGAADINFDSIMSEDEFVAQLSQSFTGFFGEKRAAVPVPIAKARYKYASDIVRKAIAAVDRSDSTHGGMSDTASDEARNAAKAQEKDSKNEVADAADAVGGKRDAVNDDGTDGSDGVPPPQDGGNGGNDGNGGEPPINGHDDITIASDNGDIPQIAPVTAADIAAEIKADAKRAQEEEDKFEAEKKKRDRRDDSDEDEDESGKVQYLFPAIPEIDTGEARKARDGKKADLRRFADLHPEYEAIYSALEARGAFSFVNQGGVEIGGWIYFVIDPTFPTYTDKNGVVHQQILMETGDANDVREGNGQVVGILSAHGERYAGLDALRSDIMSGYSEFIADERNAGKSYVFPKTSKVWSVRSGLLRRSDDSHPIKDLAGYNNENAAIVVVTKKGTIVLRDPEKHKKDEINLSKSDNEDDEHCAIYYISEGSQGQIPIRLNVAHFNKEEATKDEYDSVFGVVGKMAAKLHDAIDVMNSGKNVFASVNKDVKQLMHDGIGKMLFTDDIAFSYGIDKKTRNLTFRLSVTERDEKGRHIIKDGRYSFKIAAEFVIDPAKADSEVERITHAMFDALLGLNLSFRCNDETIGKLIEDGHVTANVEDLMVHGANFYCDAYDPKSRTFHAPNEQPEETGAMEDEQANLVDEKGHPFVKAPDGSVVFGEINAETGLTPAPIKMSQGFNDGDSGYGLAHIESQHGKQIRDAGFKSIEEFVQNVARNYTTIRKGNPRGANDTYLLEVTDKHNNTLFIELSKDGSYWNVNSAGIFRESYSKDKEVVWTLPTIDSSTTADAAGVNRGLNESGTATSEDSPQTTSSADKGTENPADAQAGGQQWGRYPQDGVPSVEVSSANPDKAFSRFSAKKATFKPKTYINGKDVGGYTIEQVYQTSVKQGTLKKNARKTGRPSANSIVNVEVVRVNDALKSMLPDGLRKRVEALGSEITDAEKEDVSYYIGYLPLWREWARQNPQAIIDLAHAARGAVLTDQFASSRVSQARALAQIIDESIEAHFIELMQELSLFETEKSEAASVMYDMSEIYEAINNIPDERVYDEIVKALEEREAGDTVLTEAEYNRVANLLRSNGVDPSRLFTRLGPSDSDSDAKRESQASDVYFQLNAESAGDGNRLIDFNQMRVKINAFSKMNKRLDSFGSDKKIKQHLTDFGIDKTIIDFVMEAIKLDPSLKSQPLDMLINAALSNRRGDMLDRFIKGYLSPVDKALESHLSELLGRYGIDVVESDMSRFGGALGVFDVLNKVIYLANDGMRNAITLPEEFAHAFVELMGSVNPDTLRKQLPENRDFTFLYSTVEGTSIYRDTFERYKNVYTNREGKPDIYRIKKEAIARALAASIADNWNDSHKDSEKGFWNTLKDWFQKIIDKFKGAEYISFDSLIDVIGKEIVDGNLDRLKKVDSSQYRLLNYASTIAEQNKRDGGKAFAFMRFFTDIGNIITGSLSYRYQGTVYRPSLDALHDIDMIVPSDVHGVNFDALSEILMHKGARKEAIEYLKGSDYFKRVLAKYPKLRLLAVYPGDKQFSFITINSIYCEDDAIADKFQTLSGSYAERLSHFSDEERRKIYLFDFFLNDKNRQTSSFMSYDGLRLATYEVSFVSKMKMGRAKDIFDYQMWRKFDDVEAAVSPEWMIMRSVKVTSGSDAAGRNLGVGEAAFTAPIDVETEMAWLDKALPQLSRERKVDIIHGLIEVGRKGAKAYGRFENGVITISDEAVEGTTYHEAFHYVFETLLSESDKAAVLSEAEAVYGTDEADALEELLAEDFRSYMLTGRFHWRSALNAAKPTLTQRIREFFRRLLDIVTHREAVTSVVFDNIRSGEYAEHSEFTGGRGSLAKNYDGAFRQEHIDAAVRYLSSPQNRGVKFSFSSRTNRILYDPVRGFSFTDGAQVNGPAISDVQSGMPHAAKARRKTRAVKEFLDFIGSTGNNFDYLAPEVRSALEAKGETAEMFDNAPKELKDRLLLCAGV